MSLVALLALPCGAQAANVVVPRATAVETVVPAGDTQTVRVSCASPAVALNAAVTRLGNDVSLRRSVPGRGAGDWRFTFAARRGSRRVAAAELRCVRLDPPTGVSGARLEVRTRKRTGIAIGPGESEVVRIRCGAAYAGTGYGLTRGARGGVRVASAVPTATGWNFRLENVGTVGATAGVSARCLRREVQGSRGGDSTELRFRVARREFADTAGPGGSATFSHSCRRGQFSVATGSEVDPLDAIALIRSHAAATRAGRWVFGRASAGDQVTTHLVCLGRGSRFG